MSRPLVFCFYLLLASVATPAAAQSPPLALHPENPHYFLFRGQPTVIISSAEHYGAVLNLDFDYIKYLDELHAHGLNHSRLFSGSYVEPAGAFNIQRNTLAPAAGRFLSPWARSDTAGYAGGGNKFDLTKWSDEYFARLQDFVAQASERGIIIEVNLFCPFYGEEQWALSPQNAVNNINNVGKVARTDVYTLDKHGGLLDVHDQLTRKIVSELQEFDNVYYEICNEPYFGGVTLDWQHHIADTIVATEKERALAQPHLISRNVANGAQKIDNPHPAISIYNFHYASPPEAVALNFDLKKAIGDNETGFKGTADTHYRMEAWEFLLAGGALYSNLDYSFAVGFEDGTFQYPETQPGGGNRGFRQQLRILKQFLAGFAFLRMQPVNQVLKQELPAGTHCRVLGEEGKQYAAYVFGPIGEQLVLDVPGGEYEVQWVSVLDGSELLAEKLAHPGGQLKLKTPDYDLDVALKIMQAGAAK